MPAAKKTPAPKRKTSTRTARKVTTLEGLEVSLDGAQKAVGDLRRDLSTGGRKLVKDIEAAIKAARRDLARTRKEIQHDLGDLGGALTPRRANSKPAAKKTAAKKTAAKPAAKTARKPAAKSAAKPAAAKPAAAKPAAAKPAAKRAAKPAARKPAAKTAARKPAAKSAAKRSSAS